MLAVSLDFDNNYVIRHKNTFQVLGTVKYGEYPDNCTTQNLEGLDQCLEIFAHFEPSGLGAQLLEVITTLELRKRHTDLLALVVEVGRGDFPGIRYILGSREHNSIVEVQLGKKLEFEHFIQLTPLNSVA